MHKKVLKEISKELNRIKKIYPRYYLASEQELKRVLKYLKQIR